MIRRFFRRIKGFYDRNPLALAYLVIVASFIAAIAWQNHLGSERKYQICYAEIEDRVLIEDILGFVSQPSSNEVPDPATLPPELQKLLEQNRKQAEEFNKFAEERLKVPPTICNDTGLTEEKIREDLDRRVNG